MQKLRNIAIIAHVDHGKTTLVDKMILAGNILRDNAKQTGELILDNNDLERERGITILSKNVSVIYKDYKINIIDTPGHADFGGEVERVLNMCDGVLLLVDAFEGTMPQTRFVLQKALALGKKPIVVINKVDKPNCRPEVVNEQVFDLMFTLDATEEQLDYKTIYGSAKQGWMSHKWNEPTDSLVPLLDAIIDEIPEPAVVEGTPQMLITSLEYSSYTGRIAVGKVTRGSLRAGQNVTLAKRDGATMQKTRIKDLMVFEGLGKKKVDEVPCGEICAIMGIEGFEIGDTICDYENPEPLPPIAIDEPTMSMLFTINNSPFFGKDGKYVTSRHIKERLDRELEKNLALRVTPGPSADSFNVFGRGVLHLSVLIETMRREGYELQVGQPRVIVKEIDGKKCEPVEELTVAFDALAVIVHPSNPVSRLTREQLEGIFRGKITNWKQVGGEDRKIVVYSRETSSGTYEFFKESVLKHRNYMPAVLSMPATGAIIQSVSQTPGAIGYVGLAYLNPEVKALAVSYDGGGSYVAPTFDNARSKSYPIVRPLYFYYTKSNEAAVRPLVDYLTSDEGQAMVASVGFIPIR